MTEVMIDTIIIQSIIIAAIIDNTESPRARPSPRAALTKSCTSNTLSREYPSPNQPADLLPEDDVMTSHINLERTTKQGQFGFCLCLIIGPFHSLTSRGSNFKGPSIFEGEKNACESINPFWKGILANTRAAFELPGRQRRASTESAISRVFFPKDF
jgi:hypothetical protein